MSYIKGFILLLVVAVAVLGTWLFVSKRSESKKDAPSAQATFNKQTKSTTEPHSLWVVVNKRSALPKDFVPPKLQVPKVLLRNSNKSEMQLREEAAIATEQVIGDAKKAGLDLMLVSGYRAYGLQETVYNNFVKQDGQAQADTYSARPGHSEHQTGLAVDFGYTSRQCELEACFGTTPAGEWLAKNAVNYGLILRYPEGKQSIVGYEYEPWHFRYVGKDLAQEVQKSGQTLEEFFGLPNAADYN